MSTLKSHNRNNAFTLAEVLITLMILGIISMLVIPNVLKNIDRHTHEVKAKKAYSFVLNSIRSAMAKNGCTDIACVMTNNGIPYDSTYVRHTQQKQVVKELFSAATYSTDTYNQSSILTSKCVPLNLYGLDGTQYTLNRGGGFTSMGMFTYCLPDGMGIAIWDDSFRPGYGASCAYGEKSGNQFYQCLSMFIFTDGKSQKAIIGKNVFGLYIMGNGSLEVPADNRISSLQKARIANYYLIYLLKNNWQMDYL